jgi:hypothetical protein
MEDFQVFILQTKSSLSLVFTVPNMEKFVVENSENFVKNSEKSINFSEQFLNFSSGEFFWNCSKINEEF